jgi:hypothetical protein
MITGLYQLEEYCEQRCSIAVSGAATAAGDEVEGHTIKEAAAE